MTKHTNNSPGRFHWTINFSQGMLMNKHTNNSPGRFHWTINFSQGMLMNKNTNNSPGRFHWTINFSQGMLMNKNTNNSPGRFHWTMVLAEKTNKAAHKQVLAGSTGPWRHHPPTCARGAAVINGRHSVSTLHAACFLATAVHNPSSTLTHLTRVVGRRPWLTLVILLTIVTASWVKWSNCCS